jgi:hypothetical protein
LRRGMYARSVVLTTERAYVPHRHPLRAGAISGDRTACNG